MFTASNEHVFDACVGGGRYSVLVNFLVFIMRLITLELFMFFVREHGHSQNAAKRADAYRTERRTELPVQKPAGAAGPAATSNSSIQGEVKAAPADTKDGNVGAAPAAGRESKAGVPGAVPAPAAATAASHSVDAGDNSLADVVEVELLPEVPESDSALPSLPVKHLPKCVNVTVGTWSATKCTLSFYWSRRQLAVTTGRNRLVFPFDSLYSVHIVKPAAGQVSPRTHTSPPSSIACLPGPRDS